MKRLTQKKHFAEPQHDEAVLDDHCLQPADQQPHEVIKDFHVQNMVSFCRIFFLIQGTSSCLLQSSGQGDYSITISAFNQPHIHQH